MSIAWRVRLPLAGSLLLLLSLFLPIHGCHAHPRQFEPAPPEGMGFLPDPENADSYLLIDMPAAWAEGWERSGLPGALWALRTWYPLLLVPFWLAALMLRPGRRLGLAALGVSAGIAVFEVFYLLSDFNTGFASWGPRWLWPVEALAVWAVVVACLAWRRPGRRSPADVEATVASQALLGALHALSFAGWDALRWTLYGHGPLAIAQALAENYRAGYWAACAGFLLIALPGYLSGGAAAPGYDPAFPWPSPSSTRTRTPTSTGSTPTGTPSSSAPAPPASSPS